MIGAIGTDLTSLRDSARPGAERDSLRMLVSDTAITVFPSDSASLRGKERGELAFSSSGALGVYHPNGYLDVRRNSSWTSLVVAAGMTLRTADERFLLLGPAPGDRAAMLVTIIDPRRAIPGSDSLRDSVEVRTLSPIPLRAGGTPVTVAHGTDLSEFHEPIAVSPAGRIAIGTADGDIIVVDADAASGRINDSLTSPGVANAMAFLDETRLLVAGEFRGVHLLAPGRTATQVGDAQIGTTALTLSIGLLAASEGGRVTTAAVSESLERSDLGTALVVGTVLIALFGLQLSRRPAQAPPPARANEKTGAVDVRIGTLAVARTESAAPEPPQEPPRELVDAVVSGDCILIAGGGLGIQAGLPTWNDFLHGLADAASRAGVLDAERRGAIDRALDDGSYTSAAEVLERVVPQELFRTHAHDVFRGATPGVVHRTLGRLPFAGAVTTNYDRLLFDAFASRTPRAATSADSAEVSGGLLDAVRARQFFLLNILGRVDRPETLVFTSRAYRDLLGNDLPLKQLLRSLFERYTVLFVGMALTSIRDFLDAIEVGNSAQGGTSAGVRHFALVGQLRRLESYEVQNFRDKYGIELIGFVPDSDWTDLDRFLKKLPSTPARAMSQPPPAERPRITRLVLENIGPFVRLDIALAPNWNVILGDNGVGKTVALRAIAAALLGRDAPASIAPRLLRTGTGSARGRIEVYGLGTTPYTMDLRRDLGGRPIVDAAMVSPLRLSKWLVIGFPALRALPPEGERRGSYEEGARRVQLDSDLSSLATDSPDGRAADLRSWLRELDRRVKTAKGRERDLAVALQTRFAEIVAALTPGAELKYLGVDPDGSISLSASGQAVPLEYVSQGTASVLCWVGVLLQRMYEVHHELEKPEEGPTLVLIDEIDAHMHPAWQRKLAATLKVHLPHLQVLATTHSPMIVGSMKPSEIFLARRREGVAEIVPAGTEGGAVDPKSMSVSQLLTSPLFALGSEHVNQEASEMHETYIELASRLPEALTPEEHQKLAVASTFLDKHRLSTQDRYDAARAYDAMQGALEARIAGMPAEDRQRVLREIKVLLVEASAGMRAPEAR